MANDNSDLWPPDLVVDVLTPLMILNEQAEALAKRTQGVVKGEVLNTLARPFELLTFDLLAPAIGFRHRLLAARFVMERPYPVVLIADSLSDPLPGIECADESEWNLSDEEHSRARLAHTPDDVRKLLKQIFNNSRTRGVLFSMVARSNEVTGGVRTTPES
ncbi:MAG: hypothetical protein L0241_01250 [Planctomycetia bacterium]|nr:hypothetical protein [Planctomycetia bacterium]